MSSRKLWRSLEQLENSAEYQRWAESEFPAGLSEVVTDVSRRNFLTLMGASAALAGLTGCIRRKEELILPYSKAPEDVLPGVPNFYASAYAMAGVGFGVLVESHEGRPTKIEGNPDHPASRGSTDAYAQASVLDLYDPDRQTRYYKGSEAIERNAFLDAVKAKANELKGKGGAGLRFLSEASASPTLDSLRAQLLTSYPQAVWHSFEPLSRDEEIAGAKLAYGAPSVATYALDKAKVIVSLDSDFLGLEPNMVQNARQWAQGRRVDNPSGEMNRLYVAEGTCHITGAVADHRMRVATSHVHALARVLASQLAAAGVEMPAELTAALQGSDAGAFDAGWLKGAVADLTNNRGAGVVLVGRRQPREVHALAHAINVALGNVGQDKVVVVRTPSVPASVEGVDTSLAGLVAALKGNQVDTLVILGGNPAYNMPADVEFANLLKAVPNSIRLGSHRDETGQLCSMSAPRSHFLESWGDAAALDGTAAIVQPLIDPLFNSLSDIELVSYFLDVPSNKGMDLVKAFWQAKAQALDFEKAWRKMLHDGVIANTEYPVSEAALDAAGIATALTAKKAAADAFSSSNMELVFAQDSKLFDGRFANNGWMMEMPDPITKLTWDNAALISVKVAGELGVTNGDMLSLKYRNRSLELPCWILPGLADYTVVVNLGYGRTAAGRVGTGPGFNAYSLRESTTLEFDGGASLAKVGGKYKLATTQEHGSMEGRPLIMEATFEEYKKDPKFLEERMPEIIEASVFKEHQWVGQQWGLAVDLTVCTGCSTCVVACQAENNIPVVGKSRVLNGREMHWMRIDRYFAGDDATAQAIHQPLMCQQCESAPCESVCPVAATVHSANGGLNDMVYNRCIGTRYCANNCPYKVRRFNYFNYHEDFTEIEKMSQNPEVTVRMRGVMEKCTYCIQRINRARRDMKLSGKTMIADGTITPACAQACPVEAIVFGDINDKDSRITKQKARDVNYVLLGELNIKPRTSYLARITNPNPELG